MNDEAEDSDLRWKADIKERAADRFLERSRRSDASDLMAIVYGVLTLHSQSSAENDRL